MSDLHWLVWQLRIEQLIWLGIVIATVVASRASAKIAKDTSRLFDDASAKYDAAKEMLIKAEKEYAEARKSREQAKQTLLDAEKIAHETVKKAASVLPNVSYS